MAMQNGKACHLNCVGICLQDVRKGKQDVAAFIAMIKDLLADLRGRKGLDPNTVAGRLLQVQDPVSGEPLSDDHIVPELGNVLTAGMEGDLSSRFLLLDVHLSRELSGGSNLCVTGIRRRRAVPLPDS